MQKEARKQLGVIGAAMLLPMSVLAANNSFVGTTGIAGSLPPQKSLKAFSTLRSRQSTSVSLVSCLTKQVNLLLALRLF